MMNNKAIQLCMGHMRRHSVVLLSILALYILSSVFAPISLTYLNTALTLEGASLTTNFMYLAFHCLLRLLSVAGDLGSTQLWQKYSVRIGSLLKKDIINKLFLTEISAQKEINSSEWQSKFALCNRLSHALVSPLFRLTYIIFTVISSVYVLFSVESIFAATIIIPVILNYILSSFFILKLRSLYNRCQETRNRMWEHIAETLDGLEDLRISGNRSRLQEQHKIVSENCSKAVSLTALTESFHDGSNSLLQYVGLIAILGVAGGIFHIPVGTLITLYFVVQLLYGALGSINNIRMEWQSTKSLSLQLQHIFNLPEMPEGHIQPDFSKKIIFEMRSVNFSRNGQPIIANGSLQICRGDFVVIQGPSGVGKSTLLDLLLGIITPDSGAVIAFGVRLQDIRKSEFYRTISYMPQFSILLKGSIPYNIFLGDTINECWMDAAQSIGLDFSADTSIESLGEGISGGQGQRIGFLRAVLSAAEVYILDEPSSSVDYETESKMYAILKELNREKTIIVVSHRETFIDVASVVVNIDSDHHVMMRRKND